MKRTSYLEYAAVQEMGVKPLRVWGYNKRGRFVGRVEVNGAGSPSMAARKASGGSRTSAGSGPSSASRKERRRADNRNAR